MIHFPVLWRKEDTSSGGMKVILTMSDYKQMRRGYGDGKSQRAVAGETGHSRNTVKKYWKGDAVPHERKPYSPRASPVMTAEMVGYILGYMQEDTEEGLPKQSHTSRRIFERLRDEHGYEGGESTVRRKVHELKDARPRAFIPLEFGPGEAMQVDWGQAYFHILDVRELLSFFCARLCYSCKFFIVAYRHQDEESFLEAFVKTFDEFGGVPGKAIFDNARVAVREGFGAHAVTQAQYGLLCAHYAFEPVFCNPRQGHEKGLVEELVKTARRQFMVPVPRVSGIAELNAMLAERCRAYDGHRIAGRPGTVGEMFEKEKSMLRPLPGRPMEIARCVSARVNSTSTVRFRKNQYSVPCTHAGRIVGIKGYPEKVDVYFRNELIASHARLHGSSGASYVLAHYLPLLRERHRAVLNAAPVRQNLSSGEFEELKANYHDPDRAYEILCRAAGVDPALDAGWAKARSEESDAGDPVIEDPVSIQDVDAGRYDELRSAAEV